MTATATATVLGASKTIDMGVRSTSKYVCVFLYVGVYSVGVCVCLGS